MSGRRAGTNISESTRFMIEDNASNNDNIRSYQLTEKFWTFIEENMGCAIPKYLQNILKLCGFDNIRSLQTLTEGDKNILETFAKTKMKKYIPAGDNLEDYYHIFSSDPGEFEIMLGHMRLLQELVKYVNLKMASYGPGFFHKNLKRNVEGGRVISNAVSMQEGCIYEERNLLDKIRNRILLNFPELINQISDSRFVSVQVQKNAENGAMFYVVSVKCPGCDIAFEAIKNVLPHNDNDLCDDLLDQKPFTSNWAHSSFVHHLSRCYSRPKIAFSKGVSDHKRKLVNGLSEGLSNEQQNEPYKSITQPNFVLNSLVKTAEQNFGRKKPGFRHSDTLKMFAAYIKMLGGTLLYETLHANLPFSLLSPSKVNEYMSEKGPTIKEGVLRSTELKEYLNKRNLPLKVWISEDATRMTPKIVYDSNTNQLVGFNLPLNRNGMPITNTYMARNANEIESHFLNDENTISSMAYTIMASPLSEKQPPFCLNLFATDNKFNFKDVISRWFYIKDKLKENGISNYGNSSDGDTKCLKAMKIASRIGQKTEDFDCEWYSSGEMAWFQSKSENISSSIYTSIYIQDTMHVATRFRNLALRASNIYPIGNSVVSNGHLKFLINNISKDQHLLNFSDVQPKDRQNFPSAEKICSPNTQNCLKKFVPGSEGTVMYLKIMHYATTPFLHPEMTVVERIRRMWYAAFALRIWRSWLVQTEGTTLKNNFISSNLYTSVEINAHSLIKFTTKLRENNEPQLMLPLLLSSQPCEGTFRQLRSMSSTFSTVISMSLYEMLYRIKRIQLQSDIVNACFGLLRFPRIENQVSKMKTPTHLPSNQVIIDVINNVREEVVADMAGFGINMEKIDCKCQVPGVYEDEEETEDNEEDSDEDDFEVDKIISFDSENDADGADDVPDDLIHNKNKLTFMPGSISLKDYSEKYPNIDENSQFAIVVNEAGTESIIRKSSICWLMSTDKASSSSDRLQRVKEDEWNKKSNYIPRNFSKRQNTESNCCVKKEIIYIGDWCLFFFQKRWLIGVVLSFAYLNQKTFRSQEYVFSSVKIAEIRPKPIGVLCTLYEWAQDGKLKLTYPNTKAEFKHTFIPIDCYKATIASPIFINNELSFDLVIASEINNFKGAINNDKLLMDIPNECRKYLTDCSAKLEDGDFLVVLLLTTRSTEKYFVAQVIRKLLINDKKQSGSEEYEVKFLKKYLNYFVFPQIDDFSIIERNSVMQVLMPPIVNRRNQLSFNDLKYKIE